MNFTGSIGTNDGDIVYTAEGDLIRNYIEHIFTPTAGALTCETKVEGVWNQVAFEDMQSTSPGTFVTTANDTGRHYRVAGRFDGIRFKQSGATPSNVKGSLNP